MSPPLTRPERALEARFRVLGQRLNTELSFRDQRLRFARRPHRRNVVEWRLDQSGWPGDGLPLSTTCAIAKSADDAAAIHLAYSEHWVHVGERDRVRFKSSNIRFVIASTGLEHNALQFRLEWATRWENRDGGFAFPGQGAAHPHWQVDLHTLGTEVATSTEVAIDLDAAVQTEEIDLSRQSPLSRHPSRWFHKIHLPVRAMWHEVLCEMPDGVETHQHEPSDFADIDNWVISAIRYVRHEFSAYP